MSTKLKYLIKISFIFGLGSGLLGESVQATRVKDIAEVKGVRENVLIGYGVVVGLNGSGDSSTKVTMQSLQRLYNKLGLDVEDQEGIQSQNAAAVIVTAELPPFARVGQKIDVTVSSIGDASSLKGGTLLVTPLRAGDQNVYAVAQGPVSLGSTTKAADDAFPTVGKVVNGATIEKSLNLNFAAKKNFRLTLNNPDFTTAARMVKAINAKLGGKFAQARDSGTIDVVVPFNYEGNSVELMAILENIDVNVAKEAKVVVNERTGTVVMGQDISISPVAISHGDLSIEVGDEQADDQANNGEQGNQNNGENNTEGGQGNNANQGGGGGNQQEKGKPIAQLKEGATVSDLVKVLNALDVEPKDLTAIFQTLKRVGALHAELEII